MTEVVQTASTSTAKQPLSPADLRDLNPSLLTVEILHTCLSPLSTHEAITTCTDLFLSSRLQTIEVARTVLEIGLSRGQAEISKSEAQVEERLGNRWNEAEKDDLEKAIVSVIGHDQERQALYRCLAILNEIRKRLDTYVILHPGLTNSERPSDPAVNIDKVVRDRTGEVDRDGTSAVELDDPWAEASDDPPILDDPWETNSAASSSSAHITSPTTNSAPVVQVSSSGEPLIDLASFLSQALVVSAIALAASTQLEALKTVMDRHPELWPYRFAILDGIPGWVTPGDFDACGLLPSTGRDGESQPSQSGLHTSDLLDHLPPSYDFSPPPNDIQSQSQVLSSNAIRDWYLARIESLDSLGLIDNQLLWAERHPDLSDLAQDLQHLSRLIYESNLTSIQQGQWTLSSWKAASVPCFISAYLSNSSADTLVDDINRLVIPYLHTLSSRSPQDKDLVERLLHDTVLSLPLRLVLSVFSSSKATLPQADRLIKNDLNVARLALACLYGSDQRDISVWPTMSAIFECLPVWDVSGGDLERDKEATSSTLEAIATFVRPTRAGNPPPKAKDLFIFFSPLPFASLSRALDILDVHLESGEILARWDTPVQLRFLLQSARDGKGQIELAERMVRRLHGGDEKRWTNLWGDMNRLNGGDDALLKGAFGMLSTEELMKVYLGGVLGSGKFDVARKMIRRFQIEYGLQDTMLHDVVLATSREFYENAESGNMYTGDMKLAYDCLAVAKATPAITSEREFIEATSRLFSFSLRSPTSPSQTISPVEIRHTKNKLDLVRRVLSTSEEAFRNSDLILELSDKLGYRGDETARVEVLGMLADSAVQAAEFDIAYTYCQSMVDLASSRRYRAKKGEEEKLERLRDVCWRTCLSIGRQSEYADVGNKMTVLGQAVELCPPDQIPDILKVWRKVEDGEMRLGEAAKRRRLAGIPSAKSGHPGTKTGSLPTSPATVTHEERVLGSRTAAKAAKLALDFGERWNLRQYAPSPVLGSAPLNALSRTISREASDSGSRRSSGEGGRPAKALFDDAGEAERVRVQARRALVKGVGWLLGADEKEVTG